MVLLEVDFDPGIWNHSVQLCPIHPPLFWAMPLNAFFCLTFQLSVWTHGIICLTDLQSCWRGHHLSIALSKMLSCCTHGALGVHLLKARRSNHPLVSASFAKQQLEKSKPIKLIPTLEHHTVMQWSGFFWFHLNELNDEIITSVNKHDQWVSQDTG